MSALKPQTPTATQTPGYAAAVHWPDAALPPADPRYGMTGDHLAALNVWHVSLQGAVNNAVAALSQQLATHKAELEKLKSTLPSGK